MAKEPTEQQYLIYRLYADFGKAVLEAQRFEITLGVVLFLLEGRKRAVLRKPTDDEIDAMLEEIDGEVIGSLIRRLSEFHVPSDDITNQTFKDAANNRNLLVHHFMKQEVASMDVSALRRALDRVAQLEKPIVEAKQVSEVLAITENDRMQAEINQGALR